MTELTPELEALYAEGNALMREVGPISKAHIPS
jgi:hypothetical protein